MYIWIIDVDIDVNIDIDIREDINIE